MDYKSAILVGASLLLISCGPSDTTYSETGHSIGSTVGGVIGSQFGQTTGSIFNTELGSMAGGIVGREIGKSLDEESKQSANQTIQQALEYGRSGVPVEWKSAGAHGTVIPRPAYKFHGQDCRDYSHTAYISGQQNTVVSSACRQANSLWAKTDTRSRSVEPHSQPLHASFNSNPSQSCMSDFYKARKLMVTHAVRCGSHGDAIDSFEQNDVQLIRRNGKIIYRSDRPGNDFDCKGVLPGFMGQEDAFYQCFRIYACATRNLDCSIKQVQSGRSCQYAVNSCAKSDPVPQS